MSNLIELVIEKAEEDSILFYEDHGRNYKDQDLLTSYVSNIWQETKDSLKLNQYPESVIELLESIYLKVLKEETQTVQENHVKYLAVRGTDNENYN